MKCYDDHHHYGLDYFEIPAQLEKQELRFIKKEPIAEGSFKLNTIHNGTTNEEVLRMLIHRLQGLNTKFPCRENSIVITHLETALLFLEKRTADRIARGVEGTRLT